MAEKTYQIWVDREKANWSARLSPTATVADLENEFVKREKYPKHEFRLIYRKESHDEGLDENEILEDITKEDGKFVFELMPYSLSHNKVMITCESDDLVGIVDILKGPTSGFEHVKLTRRQNNVRLAFVEFYWKNNKIAIVQKETDKEYIGEQFLITDEMHVQVCKINDSDVGQSDDAGKKWILKRISQDGQSKVLRGKRKSYPESKEKGRKSLA